VDVAPWVWWTTIIVTVSVLLFDVVVIGRRPHEPSTKEVSLALGGYVALAVVFGIGVWVFSGHQFGTEFFAGWLTEYSLSVDNLFIFLIIFRFFAIGEEHQMRVLHWGILGAIVMRFVFIFAGVSLIHRSHWVLAAFGVVLLWTGGKMLFSGERRHDPENHPVLRLLHKVLPVTEGLHGQSFFTRINGALYATPLFAALVVIEASDLVFAADSIPAALAVTPDLFLVYTSNIFAVMGLRALYFLLESSLSEFRHLKTGISIALLYVGAKLLLHPWYEIPTGWSLAVIVLVLSVSIAASLAGGDRAAR
jgi:tellurite resistance protein TerC